MSLKDESPADIAAWDVPDILIGTLSARNWTPGDLVVLPSLVRAGVAYYNPDDVPAVLAVRNAAVTVDFADGSDRRHLNEFSAGETVVIALAVAQNLTADGLIGLGKYILARAGLIVKKRLTMTGDVDVNVSIAKITRTAEGDLTIEGFQSHGKPLPVVASVLLALGGELGAAEAMQALTASEEPPDENTDPSD